jgi:hypothetical protein
MKKHPTILDLGLIPLVTHMLKSKMATLLSCNVINFGHDDGNMSEIDEDDAGPDIIWKEHNDNDEPKDRAFIPLLTPQSTANPSLANLDPAFPYPILPPRLLNYRASVSRES